LKDQTRLFGGFGCHAGLDPASMDCGSSPQ
jgi:hypothetical protein